MRVLIAEDDHSATILMQGLLHRWGYESVAVADGAAAWEAMQQPDAPQLVLLDWMMPKMDGLDVCRRLRAQQRSSYVYIIMVTCRETDDDASQALAAGADDFLPKPFNTIRLRSHLQVAERLLQYERQSLEADRQAAMTQHLAAIALMSAGIAHEINQPLNALTIMLANLQRQAERNPDLPPEVLFEKLAGMGNQVKRISQIVTHMRAMTGGRQAPALEPVCLKDAVNNVIKMLGAAPAQRHISVIFKQPPDLPALQANGMQLEQVLFNLVNNAVQALESMHRPDGAVEIEAVQDGKFIEVRVADNGPGLPGDAWNFDRIMVGSPASPRMGIGLKLVKKFITAWGGEVTAGNRSQGGAVFTIRVAAA